MVGRDRALQLLYRVLALVPADQAEATLFVQDHALTRFANNSIHQNVARKDARLAVRAVVDGRVGAATTNVLDEEGQRRAAHPQATTYTRLAQGITVALRLLWSIAAQAATKCIGKESERH